MTASSHPTTWVFDLDERTTRMSVLAMTESRPPVYATPASIRDRLSALPESSATPIQVVRLLALSAHLMETSVIYYEFAALAVENALRALELMIRLRVDPTSKAGMNRLIGKLEEQATLRPGSVERLRDMTRLRNEWAAHPRDANAFPLIMAFSFLEHIYAAVSEVADLSLD